jgi:hypothetical protein
LFDVYKSRITQLTSSGDTYPPTTRSKATATAPQRDPASVAWSHFNFRTFNYPITGDCLEFGFERSVKVRKGVFKNAEGDEFLVQDVVYGDLTGDGQAEAVVSAGCMPSHAANPGAFRNIVYVYTLRNGQPYLLTSAYPYKLPSDGDSGLFDLEGVTIEYGILAIENLAGECRACVNRIVKRMFRVEGNRLVLVEKTSRPYK